MCRDIAAEDKLPEDEDGEAEHKEEEEVGEDVAEKEAQLEKEIRRKRREASEEKDETPKSSGDTSPPRKNLRSTVKGPFRMPRPRLEDKEKEAGRPMILCVLLLPRHSVAVALFLKARTMAKRRRRRRRKRRPVMEGARPRPSPPLRRSSVRRLRRLLRATRGPSAGAYRTTTTARARLCSTLRPYKRRQKRRKQRRTRRRQGRKAETSFAGRGGGG